MTDRELLELAAKAAGMVVLDSGELGLRIDSDGCKTGYMWNPLTDDGDALRLAVKLEIDIHHWWHRIEVAHCPRRPNSSLDTNAAFALSEMVGQDGDRTAATRRAIVRAAAEIGKGMK